MQKIFYLFTFFFAANALFAQLSITGEVTDALTGKPIPNVSVEVKNKASNIQTDTLGHYKLNLPTGTYTFIISASGFNTKELLVKVIKDKQKIPNIVLDRLFNDDDTNSLTPSQLAEYVRQVALIRPMGEFEPSYVKRVEKSRRAILHSIKTRGMPEASIAHKSVKMPSDAGKSRGAATTRYSEPSRAAAPMSAPPPPPAEPSFRREVVEAKAEASRALYDKKTVVAKESKKVTEVLNSKIAGIEVTKERAESEKMVNRAIGFTEDFPDDIVEPSESKKEVRMEDVRKAKPTFLETATAAEKAKMDAEAAEELLPDEPEQKAGQLTAGEWSDLKNWNFWLRSIDTAFITYHKNWKYNFDDRYSVHVVGAENQPIADAQVRLLATDGSLVWESRTDNHGNAELWSGLFGAKYNNLIFKVLHNGKTFDFKNAKTFKTSVNTLKINASCSGLTGLDIAFVVDATGSMGDEIAYLKSEVVDVIRRVKMNNQSLDIRTASVFYKDFSDEYVTKIFPFGKSLKQNLAFIRNQFAGGGGDFEEAVPEGLEAGIDSLQWSEKALARIMFLILDAPPHLTAENIAKMHRLIQKAAQKGIRIIPITASGIDKNVEYLMKTLGVTTGGTYVFLTDDSGIGSSHIKATTEKHEVEHLNDLMVRLIKDATDTETCRRLAEKAATGGDAILDASFKLSPTPASSTIYIDMKNDIESLRITNVHGQIMEDWYDLKAGTKEIAVSAWASGVYYATVKQGNTVSTKKFSVIR